MIETLLRVAGIDIKRLARESVITVVIVSIGSFAAILTLAIGFLGFYLWLEVKFGTSAALWILAGNSTLLAMILLAVAFRRMRGNSAARTDSSFRSMPGPAHLSASPVVRAAEEAIKEALDTVRNGSRQEIAGAIAVAALIGWILGRRS
jgi:beta-lactamase regulating signal transducer with metallopeptidase domain